MAVPQWRDGLQALMPDYFGGIVSNVEEILEMHKIATQEGKQTIAKSIVLEGETKHFQSGHNKCFINYQK